MSTENQITFGLLLENGEIISLDSSRRKNAPVPLSFS